MSDKEGKLAFLLIIIRDFSRQSIGRMKYFTIEEYFDNASVSTHPLEQTTFLEWTLIDLKVINLKILKKFKYIFL